ncbi:helix-turn-helix domain-containing protein [Mumia sp. DW29H23]|uniref:helix-turn-helix domain-containing protein n=1 Tax=Mumia sp. DW29H23 TaxID=3421241 RepID=UPI003D698701
MHEDDGVLARRIGSVLRRHREKAGLSMRELAGRAGISQPFLSQVERGQSMPSMVTAYRLAEALGVPPGDLLPVGTDDRVEVVRHDEGRLVPVADRPDAALGRLVMLHPTSGLEVTEYRIEPGQHIAEWFASPGILTVYLVDGALDVEVEGEGTYRLGPRDLLTHPAPLRHRWHLVDDGPAHVLLLMGHPPV